MTMTVDLGDNAYEIVLERGSLNSVGNLFALDRKVLIVTDDGVPPEYAETLCRQCREGHIVTVKRGEGSKSIPVFSFLLSEMLRRGFTRRDCVAAVGGGVVGDLAGFAASAYMRGVDFYNVPTTLLSQVDSSIGGKTAVNLDGVKNAVGAFYQPKKVLIDPDLLSTLPKRLFAEGMAEALKMGLTSDPELFLIFEKGDAYARVDEVIARALIVKKTVVEADEKEAGLRRVLNFGHTLGHGIESVSPELFHGECVAMGILPMCKGELRPIVKEAITALGLPTTADFAVQKALEAIRHDKKSKGDRVGCVLLDEVGKFRFETLSYEALGEKLLEIRGNAK